MATVQIRPIRIVGNIAYVPLTQGYEAVIDAADADLVGQWNWHARVQKRAVYAERGYKVSGRVKHTALHRFLMRAADDLEIDHIDGDGLNNRRGNLRPATKGENARNRQTPSNNQSGFKGVSFEKRRAKWQAHIGHNGGRKWLGYFETAEAANEAYQRASAQYHGEYARR